MSPRLLVVFSLLAAYSAHAESSADEGRALYGVRCALCHPSDGTSARGPGLAGVVGRPAGALRFAYTAALKDSKLTWTRANLDRFLAAPDQMVPGTNMPLPTPDAAERRALIDYLATRKASSRGTASPFGRNEGQASSRGTASPFGRNEGQASSRGTASPFGRNEGQASSRGTASPFGRNEGQATKPKQVVASTGNKAFGDWHADAPGKLHHITISDLPAPYASVSSTNGPSHVDRGTRVPVAPPGFTVDLFAERVDGRVLRTSPNGDVFVAQTFSGRVRVMRAAPGARAVEKDQVFAEGLDQPFGIAFYPAADPKWVYVAEENDVVRFPYVAGDTKARGPAEKIIAELAPTRGGHTTRDLLFTTDDKRLLVSVGSGSNVAEGITAAPPGGVTAWEQAHGLGAAWGGETWRADVLSFDPQGGGKRAYATGLRNCVGLALSPFTHEPWCATNERDGLGDDLVPDHVTSVKEGAFYGWPFYYLGNHEEPRLAGARPDLAQKVTVPDVLVQPHSAALGIAFYDKKAFPPAYRNSAYVALHGSWNRSQRTGYKVVRIALDDAGHATGIYEDFLTGFVADDGHVWGRPVGISVLADGSLLVAEDGSGSVWRIAWGQPVPAPAGK